MEGEESKHVPESEIIRSPLQMPRVFNRLVELPMVKSTYGRVSDIYDLAKEKSTVAMIGLSVTEVSLKAVGAAVRVTYTALPSSGFVGSLKLSFEKKVSQADNMACNGLQFLENQWPKIKDRTGKIMAAGSAKIEQSDVLEVFLTVTEAAVDYFNPPQQKLEEADREGPPVVQTKVDRIRGIVNSVRVGAGKVLYVVASFPLQVTLAGFNGAKTVVLWSLDTTKSVLHHLPVVDKLLAVFFGRSDKDEVFFSPVVLDDGREVLSRKPKPRRSTRYKPKGDYHRIIEASEPFPVSPERKRKFDKEDSEETLTVELISISQDYVSDEDPDFVPDDDEREESESTEDDDDDDDNTEYENEGDEQNGSQEGTVSEEADTKPARVTSSRNVVPLKEAGVVHGQGEVSDKTQTKGTELPVSPGVQNMAEKIEVKKSSASQKTENVSTKENTKTSVVDEEGKHSNKAQTKVSELGQGVKNLAEKIKGKSSIPQKTENVFAKEDAKTGEVNGEGKVSNKTQTKGSEQSQAVQSKGEKIDVKKPASHKTENVTAKENAKTAEVISEGKVSNKTQTKVSGQSQGVQSKGEKIDVKKAVSQKTESFSLKTALRKQVEQVMFMEEK